MVVLNPYIAFNGNARQAIEFYHSVFGGELTISTFGDAGMPGGNPDGIMHAMLVTPTLTLMASDAMQGEFKAGGQISVSLSGPKADELVLTDYWAKLSASGTVAEPLSVAPWGDTFGMCTDGFGVFWMVNIAAQ